MRGFSEPEIQQFVISVRDNLIDSMVVLVDAMDVLGIIFEKGTNLRNADRLREMSRIYKTKGKLASFNEMTDILHQLWQDKGIQRCYERSNEFHLIDSAQYFLSKVYDLVQQKSFYFVETILINSIFRSTTLWLRDTVQAQMTFCERGS